MPAEAQAWPKKKWTPGGVHFFILAVYHLLNFNGALAGLPLCDPLGRNPCLAILCIADNQLHEFIMIGRVI